MTLLSLLPPVRGSLREQAPLSGLTWLRVGGPAEVLFKPKDVQDLMDFRRDCPPGLSVRFMGLGSNLLVRDGGIEGVVIRLGRGFGDIKIEGQSVIAGAAALDRQVAQKAAQAGIAGLGFLIGVPGSIGGALRMNAGAHGGEIKDVLVWAEAVSPKGELVRLEPKDLGYSYRHCDLPEGYGFVRACFQGAPGNPLKLEEELKEITAKREQSQPIREKTGGSTFKNPPGHSAWKLVDEAGLRGHQIGGAQISQKHCNFLINTGQAQACELEALGELMRKKVKEKSGIDLVWEIKRWGKA